MERIHTKRLEVRTKLAHVIFSFSISIIADAIVTSYSLPTRTGKSQRQEEMYATAWETYKHKRGVYEPSPQPISLQKRRFTRVKLAPNAGKEIDSSIERVRLAQD